MSKNGLELAMIGRDDDSVTAVDAPLASAELVSKRGIRRLVRLFWEMLKLAALVIGGGYVILATADERFSRRLKWVRPGELFEALPVFQIIPGIIGGHVAVYVGSRVAGAGGAAVALLGMILPSVVIFLVVSVFYASIPLGNPVIKALFLGLRAALTAVLFNITLRLWRKSVAGMSGYLMVVFSCFAMTCFRISPGRLIVFAMLAGLLLAVFGRDGKSGASSVTFRSLMLIPLLFLGYGFIAFGGGFVLVPSYLRDFVGPDAPYLQLTGSDFANVMALTELTPGPMAVNCATFFGYLMASVPGAFVATVSVLLPGSVIMFFALRSLTYFQTNPYVCGVISLVRPVAVSMLVCTTISFAGMSIWNVSAFAGTRFSPLGMLLFLLTLLAIRRQWVSEVAAIVLSAIIAAFVGFALLSVG